MVSNQKPPGKRKPIISEGHARKRGRRARSAPWLRGASPAPVLVSHCPVSVYSSGSSLALPLVMGGESTPSPASPQTGWAFATLHTPDFNPSYAALGEKGDLGFTLG